MKASIVRPGGMPVLENGIAGLRRKFVAVPCIFLGFGLYGVSAVLWLEVLSKLDFIVALLIGTRSPQSFRLMYYYDSVNTDSYTVWSSEERVPEFNNPQKSKIIKIDVLSPCSPKQLGLSDDEHSLGIALQELRIEPL
jgi:hypothetical protein